MCSQELSGRVGQEEKQNVAVKEAEESETVEEANGGVEKQAEERAKQDGESVRFMTDTASAAESSEECAEHADTSSHLIVGTTQQSDNDDSVNASGVKKQGDVVARSNCNIVDDPTNTMSEMEKKHPNRSCTIL